VAGLPGTGLGGIFYLLLFVWIVARESWMLAQGAWRRERWLRIAKLAALVAGAVGAVMLQVWAMRRWIEAPPLPAALTFDAELMGVAVVTLVPFGLLALLLTATHALRLLLRRRARMLTAPAE
jgi:hypothetical protein